MENTDLVSRISDLEKENGALKDRVTALENSKAENLDANNPGGYIAFADYLGQKYFGNEYNEWKAGQPQTAAPAVTDPKDAPL